MSNIKSVLISGSIPFNYYNHDGLAKRFAVIQAPSIGLRVDFGTETLVPNAHGGKTAMYEFWISGEEALNERWIEGLAIDLKAAGAVVTRFVVCDIEACETLCNFTPEEAAAFDDYVARIGGAR